MVNRKLGVLLVLIGLLGLTACGDEGNECGPGTVEAGGECIPEDAPDEIKCGDGTELVNGECVPEEEPGDDGVECGDDTELVDGKCVSTVDVVECGPDTELVDGRCVSTIEEIECGAGTLLVDGACELIDPLDGIDQEPPEPNDPFLDGTPGILTLGAEGETVRVAGTISPPTDVGEGDETFALADFDVFFFQGAAGQRISLEVTAVGAPSMAVSLSFLPEEGDANEFLRFGFPFESRNASKEVVLPFDGAYMIRVGDASDTAAFFTAITEGELDLGGIAGEPSGSDEFTWIMGLTLLAEEAPETFAGNGSFTFEGDVRQSPQALLQIEAGRIVQLGVEAGPGVAATTVTSNPDYEGVAQDAGLLVVPEGGLLITVDSFFDRGRDTSFTLTSIEQPLIDGGTLAADGTISVDGELGGNIQFHSFTTEEPSVVFVDGQPTEGSDANLALFLLTPDLSQTIAVSSDQLGGFFDPPSQEESLAAYLAEPGTYLLAVFHEGDPEDQDLGFNLDIAAVGVTAFDDLAAGGAQTLEATLAEPGDEAWFTVNTTELGLLSALAEPGEDLDIDLQVFTTPFLAFRNQFLAAGQGFDGFEGEAEAVELALAPTEVVVRVVNSGFFPAEDTGVSLTMALEGIEREVEPNNTAGQATAVTLGEDGALVGGELALNDDTTVDFFSFELADIAEVTVSVQGVGQNPGADFLVRIFGEDDLQNPLAEDSTFIDFFTGQPIDPTFNLALLPGTYFVSVEQLDGEASGTYLVGVAINEVFDCLPNSTRCNEGGNVEVCFDGFDFEETICSANAACVSDGQSAGCLNFPDEEPNNDPDNAQNIGTLAEGHVDGNGQVEPDDDEDWFSFTLDATARVSIETAPGAGPSVDTTLTLLDADQTEIAFNDDTNGLFSFVQEVLPAGTYFIQVQSFSNSDSGSYRLLIDVELAQCEGLGIVGCDGDDIVGCDGFELSVVDTCQFGCEVDEVEGALCVEPDFIPEQEPNDGPILQANEVAALPFNGFGTIDRGDDRDFYFVDLSFPIEADFNVTFETSSAGNGDDVDTVIYICPVDQGGLEGPCGFARFSNDNDNIDQNDDGGDGSYSLLELTLAPGQYFFVVESFGTDTGEYLVNIDAQVEGFNSVLEEEPNDDDNQANNFNFDAVLTGAIDEAGDQDWYSFEITEPGTRLNFETFRFDGGVDTQVFLCDTSDPGSCTFDDGNLDSDDDGAGDLQSQLTFTFDEAGTYFFVVRAFSTRTGGYQVLVLDETGL